MKAFSVHPEIASFGPERRFSRFCNPRNSALCLRLQKRSSLALNQNLLFLNGHYLSLDSPKPIIKLAIQ